MRPFEHVPLPRCQIKTCHWQRVATHSGTMILNHRAVNMFCSLKPSLTNGGCRQPFTLIGRDSQEPYPSLVRILRSGHHDRWKRQQGGGSTCRWGGRLRNPGMCRCGHRLRPLWGHAWRDASHCGGHRIRPVHWLSKKIIGPTFAHPTKLSSVMFGSWHQRRSSFVICMCNLSWTVLFYVIWV
jgi:hypothetical protein